MGEKAKVKRGSLSLASKLARPGGSKLPQSGAHFRSCPAPR